MQWSHVKRAAIAAMVLLVLGAMSNAGALTPAGTLIRNQASATYEINGVQYTSTSNEVITEVLPVYGFDLLLNGQDVSTASDPALVQHAYVGNAVYFQYELRSYSNTGDTINLTELVKDGTSTMSDPSAVYVYEDVNGNGAVDPGEPLMGTWNPSTSSWSAVNQNLDGDGNPDLYLPSGESKFFVVTYTIPSGASDGDVYILGVSSQSHGDNTKEDPGSEGGNNYHKVIVSVDASIWASKTASPLQVAQNDTITYTIAGSNVGGQPTDDLTSGISYDNDEDGNPDGTLNGVILKDGIDTSLVYFAGGVNGIPSGTVLYYYDGNNDGNAYWQTDEPSDSTLVDSIAYVFPNLDPGQQFEFTFKVRVKDGLAPNTTITNRAVIEYGRQSANDTTFTTNDAIVTVSAQGAFIYQVFIGPYHNSQATGGTPPTTNGDTAAVDTVFAGTCIYDTVTVLNNGNATDEIALSYSVTAGDEDWLTSLVFLHMDGVTPIANNRVTLAAGDSADVIVKYCISDTVNTTNSDLVIQLAATSVNQPDSFNLTYILVDSIIGLGVDLGNRDGVSGTVNNTPADSTTSPGRCVSFPMDVLNTSGVSDVYTLSATVPANWTVTFYPDENNDGVADTASPITQVGPIEPGQEGHFVAYVCIPQNQSPNTYDVTLTATSTRDPSVSDAITNTVTVTALCLIDIDPDRHGTGFPGGVVTYQHRVLNMGNTTVTVTISVNSTRGWTYVVLASDAQSVISGSFDLGPGADSIIYVRGFIPSNAPVGQPDIAAVTVSTGSCSDSVVDMTDVIAGALQMTKWIMDPDHDGNPDDSTFYSTGLPYSISSDSGTIYYRMHFKNISTDTIKSPVIYELVPTHTELDASSLGGSVPVGQLLYDYSTDGGSTWNGWSTSTSGWPSSGITNIKFGIDRNSDGNIDDNDYLLPAESGYIEFKVHIE